ncbi:hypothetical protein ACN27B_10860 [Micromonospora sp. WMMD754]|uniref:hypothetical protein n=1 Tax=Micromonospora sp. WMMD754 TaxID=3404114 RepID=UPI003BF56F70
MDRNELVEPEEVWLTGDEAEARLRQMGLEPADLIEPLELAAVDAAGCTEVDAPGAAGYVFWTRGNRYLRERLIPQGWGWTNRDNILRTISPDGSFSISAISGAGAVGVPGGQVQTRNPKGAAVATLVRYNYSVAGGARNADFLPGLDFPAEQFEPDMHPTWFLLYKATSEGIMFELSLPVDMLGSSVNRWREHIIVGPAGYGGDGGVKLDLDVFTDQINEVVDVPVERIA